MGQILYEARNLSNTVKDESQQCQSTKKPGMEDVHEHMTKAARRARYSGGVLNYVKNPGMCWENSAFARMICLS